MNEASSRSFPFRSIQLTGINQRAYLDPEYRGVDWIQGLAPETLGVVKRPAGITKLTQINQERVVAIHQTFNSNDHVLIQTDSALYSVTLDELLGRTFTTDLIGNPTDIEENMAYAIIVDKYANGVSATKAATANTWNIAPLSGVAQQLNPDGTPASFVSVATDKITLSSGTYRFRGWCAIYHAAADSSFKLKLYNATAGADLFGAEDHAIVRGPTIAADRNTIGLFGGQVTLGVTTDVELRMWMATTPHANVYGKHDKTALGASSGAEVYRYIEIIKTA